MGDTNTEAVGGEKVEVEAPEGVTVANQEAMTVGVGVPNLNIGPPYYPHPAFAGPPAAPPISLLPFPGPDGQTVMYSQHGQQLLQIGGLGQNQGSYLMHHHIPIGYPQYPPVPYPHIPHPQYGFPQEGGQLLATFGGTSVHDGQGSVSVHTVPQPQQIRNPKSYYHGGQEYRGRSNNSTRGKGRGRGGYGKRRSQKCENPFQYHQLQQLPPNYYHGYTHAPEGFYPGLQQLQLVENVTGAPFVCQTPHGTICVYPQAPNPLIVYPQTSGAVGMEQQHPIVSVPQNTSGGVAPNYPQQHVGPDPIFHPLQMERPHQGSLPIEKNSTGGFDTSSVVQDDRNDPEIDIEIGKQTPEDIIEIAIPGKVDSEKESEDKSLIDRPADYVSHAAAAVIVHGENEIGSSFFQQPFPETNSGPTTVQETEVITKATEKLAEFSIRRGYSAPRSNQRRRTSSWERGSGTGNMSVNGGGTRYDGAKYYEAEKGTFRPSKYGTVEAGIGRSVYFSNRKLAGTTTSRFERSPFVNGNANNSSRNTNNIPNRRDLATTTSLPVKEKKDGSSVDDFPQLSLVKTNAKDCGTSGTTSSLLAESSFISSKVSPTAPPKGPSWASIASGQHQLTSDNTSTSSANRKQMSNGSTASVQMIDKGSGDSAVPGLEERLKK